MDELFKQGEKVPDVNACVMHPDKDAKVKLNTNVQGFAGVLFGLCDECIAISKRNPKYGDLIGKEILRRTELLKKEMKNANTTH